MATVNKNFKTKYGIDSGGKITGPASTTDSATLNIPHGVDPTSPVNGDIWTTTSELYARINGSTRFFLRDNATNFTNAQNINSITGPTTLQLAYGTTSTGFTKTINIGPNGASGSTTNINIGSSTSGATNSTTVRGSFTVTGKATTAATTTTQAGLNLPHGTDPSAPVDGDLWTTTAGVYARVNGATVGPFGSGGASYQTTAPSTPTVGQIWVDSDETVTTLNSNDFLLKSGGTMTGNLVVSGSTTLASLVVNGHTFNPEEFIVVSLSDETTALTTGTAKLTWRAPYAMTLTQIPRASLNTASTSGLVTIDINEGGVSVLGANKLSIDANEKTSTTAATATTLADTAIADDAEITFDIDAAGTGAKGLKVIIYYKRA